MLGRKETDRSAPIEELGEAYPPAMLRMAASFFDYASLEDLTSMEWAKSLMMNSCDALLVERIDKKFDDLSYTNKVV